jgi:broad specificity phosphatase PhoE
MLAKHHLKGILFLALAAPFVPPAPAPAQVAGDLPNLIVLVRHGDRGTEPKNDPELTEAGKQRGQDLAAALRGTKFTAIITTQFTRNRSTAQPTASALGLTPEILTITDLYNREQADAHVQAVKQALRKHAGGSVLIVDHGNMIQDIIAALGGPAGLPMVCDPIYDHMFVLVPAGGKTQLVLARYGAPSPPPMPGCM